MKSGLFAGLKGAALVAASAKPAPASLPNSNGVYIDFPIPYPVQPSPVFAAFNASYFGG